MPLYYFDFDDGETLCKGDEGIELEGQDTAQEEALIALCELVRGHLPDGDERRLAMSVRDEHGREVVLVRLVLQVVAGKLN